MASTRTSVIKEVIVVLQPPAVMLLKSLCILLVSVVVAADPRNACSHEDLQEECGKPYFPRVQPPGNEFQLLDTVEKLNDLCKRYIPYITCAVDFISTCPETGEAKYLQPSKDVFEIYQKVCSEGDPFKQDVIDMIECLLENRKIVEKCGAMKNDGKPGNVKEQCEAGKNFKACMLIEMGNICGQRPVEVAEKLLEGSRILTPSVCWN